MKAFILDRYGKSAPLRLGEAPEPTLGDEDLLVQVHAAALNLLDSKIRDGAFKPILPYRPPFVLGHDVAGKVLAVGARVSAFKVGDEIYARPRDGRIGTFAERIAIHHADAAHKPKNLSMAEAASVPLVGLTAWQVLVERGALQRGQKVFIQAGSGGVGAFAIQLAKHIGAVVATTTSTPNVGLVKGLGADLVVDYTRDAFEKTLSGYDIVLNSLDGETLEKSLDVLKPGGQLISISGPPEPAFAKSAGLNGALRLLMALLSRKIRRKAKAKLASYSFVFMRASGPQLKTITALIEAGAIKPVIDRIFPFEALNDAMAYIETGRARGKVIIQLIAD